MESIKKTEKVTINVNVVDLGYIDLLVDEGFYSNRTDLIKTAIRNQLNQHSAITNEITTKKNFIVGIYNLSEKELEISIEKSEKLDIKVIGYLYISKSISDDLVKQAVNSISVKGGIRCSSELKEYFNV